MNAALRLILPTRPPLLALIGVGIALAGLGLDTVVHLTAVEQHHHEIGFSLQEHGAHLVGLIGMVVALAGIVIDGIRRPKQGGHSA